MLTARISGLAEYNMSVIACAADMVRAGICAGTYTDTARSKRTGSAGYSGTVCVFRLERIVRLCAFLTATGSKRGVDAVALVRSDAEN